MRVTGAWVWVVTRFGDRFSTVTRFGDRFLTVTRSGDRFVRNGNGQDSLQRGYKRDDHAAGEHYLYSSATVGAAMHGRGHVPVGKCGGNHIGEMSASGNGNANSKRSAKTNWVGTIHNYIGHNYIALKLTGSVPARVAVRITVRVAVMH